MVELVTKNYTDVIFDLAKEDGSVEALGEELNLVAEVLRQNPDFGIFLKSPQILKKDKLDLLDRAFGEKVSLMALNFLKVLVENRRSEYILEIAESYKKNERDFLGIAYVEAITALAMEDDQKDKLIASLEKKLGKKIELNNVIDPNIIGGMKIKVGEKAIDGTLASRLKALQSEISK